jgi:glycosyltransferase involved in cell wall biosynthesis
MARVTVLLPVHRPPALLPYAIESVLAQAHEDFELIVVCDGAPVETAACARAYAARDPRVKTFARPKGERHGEAHRHAALMELATGDHVAHICDDDLWFPNHLEEIERLLAEADFGHVICTFIHADGSVEALASDITAPDVRARFLNKRYNCFGPTDCGYRLAAYRSLAEGWAPAARRVDRSAYVAQIPAARGSYICVARRCHQSAFFGARAHRNVTCGTRHGK